MERVRQLVGFVLCLAVLGIATLRVGTQERSVPGEWPYFGGDKAFTRYSPLDQINRDNVARLKVVWRHAKVDPDVMREFPALEVSDNLRSTPIMADGVVYVSNGIGLVEALDPASGRILWVQGPTERTFQGMSGRSARGVAYWRSGANQRVFSVRGEYLYALNAKTGKYVVEFGDQGKVSLKRNEPWAGAFSDNAGPIVVGDIVVVGGRGGGAAGDFGVVKEAAPEDVRGYDARTGNLVWTFHVRPRPGELGADGWGDAWWYSGAMGAWCCLSADEDLGHVYVPTSAPGASMYGGHRPGDNLFADSLVALDAQTGKRVWHFQMVHHDLWDYDTVGAAVLGDITVNGKRIKAVMQSSKTGFVYVFDRVTGAPVWPIEERPVPQSAIPGEHTAPTQPFPTKPPPFDQQGLTEDDLIDFTPELKAEARKIFNRYVTGPLFTPPSVISEAPGGKQGTIVVPGTWGAANWHSGAFDPETGMYYISSHTLPFMSDMVKGSANATKDFVFRQVAGPTWVQQRLDLLSPLGGLPLTRPPYGRITAIDMNRGDHAWVVANGDGPRNHPLLKDLKLPPLGIANRAAPLITKTLLFIGEGSDLISGVLRGAWGNKFRAYDKATGKVIWETELPAGTTGAPITYHFRGKQYIVVAIGSRDYPAEWVALALP